MPESAKDAALRALYTQIEEICGHFRQLHLEAMGIVESSQMPDATLHLNDVLHTTEQATHTILDSSSAIGGIVDASSAGETDKGRVSEHLSRIYEACSFQDISGQRIKKVLQHLQSLETQLQHLSETAGGYVAGSKATAAPASKDILLNGPALSSQAPSQSDIDDMFKNA